VTEGSPESARQQAGEATHDRKAPNARGQREETETAERSAGTRQDEIRDAERKAGENDER
jgi:hypothetical protein